MQGKVYGVFWKVLETMLPDHFNNEAVKAPILKETDPTKIKRLGERVKIDAAEWERISCDIMKRGIWAKFSSGKTLKRYLKATYPNILAESSPTDLKWGTGYGQTDPNAHDSKLWRGRNLLGKALMEVREDIMKRDRIVECVADFTSRLLMLEEEKIKLKKRKIELMEERNELEKRN
ncbi:unnamed protein product [Mytilus coruscus]|uniref:NADAR domain-containing protein n=1 Tax=Mytilus coruscus TaxID=42192 RepID=A0A6J8CXC8_MYTCO|nr:unnamed protein product [Mytilus coruscus]